MYLTLFYSLLIGIGCGTIPDGPDNSIRFAYQEYYLLEEGETELPTNDVNNAPYGPISNLGEYQIPINKIIEHKDYHVYLGLSITGKVSEILEASKTIGGYKVLNADNNDLFFKSDSLFVCRYIYEEQVEKLAIVVNLVTKDSLIASSFYDNRSSFIADKILKYEE